MRWERAISAEMSKDVVYQYICEDQGFLYNWENTVLQRTGSLTQDMHRHILTRRTGLEEESETIGNLAQGRELRQNKTALYYRWHSSW